MNQLTRYLNRKGKKGSVGRIKRIGEKKKTGVARVGKELEVSEEGVRERKMEKEGKKKMKHSMYSLK